MPHDKPLMLTAAIAFTVAAGAACGLANGLITTVGKIEPFIATLGTMGIYRGLTTWLSQGGAITLREPELQALYRPVYFGSIFSVPVPIAVILVVTAIAAFVLYRMRYGRHVVAVGSNRDVARYSGIPVDRVRTIADDVPPAEYGRREAFAVRKRLKTLGPVLVPREFVFMDRAAIGLGAAFLHLRAELNFGRMFADSVADFSTDALAIRQQQALQAVGLATHSA